MAGGSLSTWRDDRMMPTRRSLLQALCAGAAANALPLDLAHAAGTDSQVTGSVEGWVSQSPFLARAFAPVFDERDDAGLVVEGELPRGLDGVFMRNGPNPMFAPDPYYAYPFDGTGMLHAIFLQDGKASYRNRWVATTELVQERAAGKRLFDSSFAPPPHANLSNTNIVLHAGRYLSLYEGGIPYEVDRALSTKGSYDFAGKLKTFMSAHPKQDPVTREMLAIAYDLPASRMTYLRVAADGTLDRSVDIASPWPAMLHDIAITRSYVVACICPFVFAPGQRVPATWQPERGARILLMPRDARSAGEARWIECAPFFNFHTVNAYEVGSTIELTLPWYDAYTLVHDRPIKLELHRLTIDLAAGKVADTRLDDMPCEFGRVNERHLGSKAQFGYVGLRDPRPGEAPQMGAFEAFARYDLQTGQRIVHRFAPGETVCEPVFVAAPGATREDDGYVLSFVHEEGSPSGSFVVLDAHQLDAGPIARIRLPRRIPAGLHGSWMPA
jgi:carotenoid cleavage dioxygenase-like enzyme